MEIGSGGLLGWGVPCRGLKFLPTIAGKTVETTESNVHLGDIRTFFAYFSSSFPSVSVALCVNVSSQNIFSKKQTATWRREGEGGEGYFWAGMSFLHGSFWRAALICLCLDRFCPRW